MGFLTRYHYSVWVHIFYRFLLMIFGIVVIGLYAQDLNHAHKEGKYSDGKWVFATVVGSISSVTALVYIIILLLSSDLTALVFAWDFVIFILYAALFGLFGKMYIGASDAYQSGIHRMKNAVWIDCINMILWFISAVAGLIMFFLQKRNGRRSLHTGRAKV